MCVVKLPIEYDQIPCQLLTKLFFCHYSQYMLLQGFFFKFLGKEERDNKLRLRYVNLGLKFGVNNINHNKKKKEFKQ